MITLAGYLFALLAIVIAAYLTVTVLLVALESSPDTEKENFIVLFKLLLVQLWFGTVAVIWTVLLALVAFVEHLRNFGLLYVLIGFVAVAAEINAKFGDDLAEGTDSFFTRFWVPFFRNIWLVLVRVATTLYNLFICPWNLAGSLAKSTATAFFEIAIACDEMDWGAVADRLGDAIEAPVRSLFFWVASLFTEDLDLVGPLSAIGNLTAVFEPLMRCECETLGFGYEIVIRIAQSAGLHSGVHHAVNFGISFWREILRFVVALFDAVFGSGQTVASQVPGPLFLPLVFGTDPDRAPRWKDTRDHACNATMHAGDFVDDVIGILLDVFAGISPASVPKVGPVASNALCVVYDLLQIVADVQFHLDVFFSGNFWGAIQDDLDAPFTHAYNASAGVVAFWAPLDDPITDDIGCVVSALLNTTIASLEVILRVAVAIPEEITFSNIRAFIDTPRIQVPAAFVEESALLTFACTASLMTNINEPLGVAFNETAHVITSALRLTVGLFLNIDNFFDYVTGEPPFAGQLTGNADRLFFEGRAMAVSYGDFIRQFSLIEPCPSRDPHAQQNETIPRDVDVICCLAADVESLLRIVIGAAEFVVRGLAEVAGATSFADGFEKLFILPDAPGNLERELIPMVSALLDGGTCFIPSIIAYIQEIFGEPLTCNFGTITFAELLRDVISGFLKILIVGPLRLGQGILELFHRAVVNSDCLGGNAAGCACDFLKVVYRVTLGALANWVALAGEMITCLFPAATLFQTIGGTFQNFFGVSEPDPSQTGTEFPQSLYNFICDIVNAIFRALELLVLLFTDFPAFVLEIIQAVAELPVFQTLLDAVDRLQAIVTRITSWISALGTNLRSFFSCIGGFFDELFGEGAFFRCVVSCFRAPRGCDECPRFQCSFTFPTFRKRAGAGRGEMPGAGGEGNRDFDFNVYWNLSDPEAPCYRQFRDVAEEADGGDPKLARLLERDAKLCFLSGIAARFADLVLMQWEIGDERLVDPAFLYDPEVGISLALNLTRGVPLVLSYLAEFTTNGTSPNDFNRTFIDYLAERNVVDPVIERLGMISEVLVRMFLRGQVEGAPNPMGQIIQALLAAWRYGYEFWVGLGIVEGHASKRAGDGNAEALRRSLFEPSSWAGAISAMKSELGERAAPFVAEAVGGARRVYGAWLGKAGYEPNVRALDGARALYARASARYEWRMSGSAWDEEPPPRGTPIQLERWGMMMRREADAASPVERDHWRTTRRGMYPQFAYMEDGLPRPQIVTADCGPRKCWDESGAVVGTCERDGLFCSCALANLTHGACCQASACTVETEGDCAGLSGNWTRGATCDSCSALVNDTQGACCHAGVCEISDEAFCGFLNGTWNRNLTCASPDLDEECEHCSLHLIPDQDVGAEILCPLAGDVTSAPCVARNCWSPDGAAFGNCTVGSAPLFGNPRCECALPASGACCANNTCSVISASACDALGGILVGTGCDLCDLEANATLGACCLGAPGNKTCELLGPGDCANATGIFNPGKLCGDAELDPDCEHCAARGCRSCELLVRIINVWIDLLVGCLNDFLELMPSFFAPSKGFRQAYDPPARFKPVQRRTLAGDGVRSLGRFLIRIFEWLINATIAVFYFVFRLEPPCPILVEGACCVNSTFCAAASNATECSDLGGFLGGEGCDACDALAADPNATSGACCFGPSGSKKCEVRTEGACANASGFFDPRALCEERAQIPRVDLLAIADAVGAFLTNTDPDDPDGVTFYLLFLVRCDVEEHPRCELGRQGTGLGPAILWVLGVFVLLFLAAGFFFPPLLTPLTYVFLFSPFIVLSVAYFMSLWCFVPTSIFFGWPFGLLPNCLANDVEAGFQAIDVPCLPLCHIAGDQSLPPDPFCDREDCPGSAENFRRDFPDCFEEPYLFRGPLRVLTFFLRSWAPGPFCFLFEANFVPLAFFDELPLVGDSVQFPGDSCAEPDFVDARWTWCFWANFLFWPVLLGILYFFARLFAFLWPAIVLAFVAWIQILTTLLLLGLAIFSRVARTGDKRNRYWRHRRWEIKLESPPPIFARARAPERRMTFDEAVTGMVVSAAQGGAPSGFSWGGRVAPQFKPVEKRE